MADISNSTNNTLIVGTAEADSIENQGGSYVTIDAAAGNDTINNKYRNYDNNIYRNNSGDSITINAGDGDDLIYNLNFDVAINAGDGNDSIDNAKESATVTIDEGDGNDSITNYGDSVTIDAGDGNDSIDNIWGGSNVTINAGTGADFISNSYGSNIIINAGTGDDYINNYGGSNVTIDAGDGNDSINNQHDNSVTIIGGTGDDRITLYSSSEENLIQYTEGDGHDTVWGYSDDTNSLQINSSVGWSSVVSGNNIVVTVGDGSITLVDAATSTTTTPADTSTATTPADTSTATTPADTSTATTPADTSTATTPADTSTATTPVVDPTTTTAVGQAVPTDVIFLIDKSSSMSSYIQRVKDAITSFANSLGSTNSDFRFGIVEFGQSQNSGLPVAKTFTLFNGVTPYFTSNVEEFTGTLDTNSSGSMEYGLTAIQTALLMFELDPRLAQKRIVVLTDAGCEGDGSEAEDPSGLTSTDIETALNAANVKMDVVGKVGYECQDEYEPLANSTGGKFYDINSLSYYNYFEDIADDILGRAHVNINLDIDSVPEGTTSGVFVVTPTLNAAGAIVPASSDATFKAAAEEGDYVVGYVIANKAYMADPNSPWRQIVTIPDNWIVSGTYQDDALNVTGSNAVISGSLGKDNISINEDAVNTTLVDVSELQNGSDTLSFSKRVTPGTLQQNFTGGGTALYTTDSDGELDFVINLQGIAALDESLLNCEVSNAGKPNTIRELIYGEVADTVIPDVTPPQPPIVNDTLMGRIMFAQWGYGFTPPPTNPLYDATTDATMETTASTIATDSLATSADLAVDFGSPSLDEIAPVNFAVTQDNFAAQDFNAEFSVKQAYKLSSASKPKFS